MATHMNVVKTFFSVGILTIPVLLSQADNLFLDLDENEECRIPLGGFGGCVPIHQCHSMTSFLESVVSQGTQIPPDLVQLLRSYQCGMQDNSIRVCCPKDMLFPKSVLNRFLTSNDEPQPPDVKLHSNYDLLPYECGLPPTSDRISGGNQTILNEFPWMVLISYSPGNGRDSYKCGGTIINDRYILTAAHCITNMGNLKPVAVRIGEHNITSATDCEFYSNGGVHCAPPVQDILIEQILPHPEFNPAEFSNDIGLLRLSRPINTSLENAKPICLPLTESVRNLNFTNTKLTVTGWGLTEFGRTSDTLLKVDIPIQTRSDCQNLYQRSAVKLTHLHLCGGGKNRQDSCGGDSGGPLQRLDALNDDVRFVQYAIVSFGARTCGRIGVPGVYTRLDYYTNWILDTIRP